MILKLDLHIITMKVLPALVGCFFDQFGRGYRIIGLPALAGLFLSLPVINIAKMYLERVKKSFTLLTIKF